MSVRSMRRPLVLCLVLACTACGRGERALDHPRARSVVLFVVDTLRADRLGPWGNERYATPAADRLAAEALVFEQAFTQSTNTNPAMSSMLTGLLPPRHGALNQTANLSPEVLTLPELLSARGVRTGAFVANLCELQDVENTAWNEGWHERFCGMEQRVEQHLWDERVVDAAKTWIAEVADQPFFAWVHLMDPHMEHRPPPSEWDYDADPLPRRLEQMRHYTKLESEGKRPPEAVIARLNALYDAEVRGVDRLLGDMLDFLGELEGSEEIALVFSADHGEELFETWHRFGHGLSMTEGVLRVPLAIRAPGVEPGRRSEPVETLAITPTVLGLLGIDPPYVLDGPSLLSGEEGPPFARSFESRMALTLRSATHRYWFRTTRDPWTRKDAPWRADAPWFQNRENLASYAPDAPSQPVWLPLEGPVLRDFEREKDRVLRTIEDAPDNAIADPEFLEQLEDLGYLGSE